jgi:hypothetical protein
LKKAIDWASRPYRIGKLGKLVSVHLSCKWASTAITVASLPTSGHKLGIGDMGIGRRSPDGSRFVATADNERQRRSQFPDRVTSTGCPSGQVFCSGKDFSDLSSSAPDCPIFLPRRIELALHGSRQKGIRPDSCCSNRITPRCWSMTARSARRKPPGAHRARSAWIPSAGRRNV